MESGYKHFSHGHNLMIHEINEGVEISCSGCNSSATGTVYVCWQCNFFLHEQCFHAARSLKHPSHPSHPLTLVPYPTYPSNSFYCNSCQNIGTGISYSCSDCEFDLHIQCAHSISNVTNLHQPIHATQSPTTYYNLIQEIIPQDWNSQNPNMAPYPQSLSIPIPNSIPMAIQNHITNEQNPNMAPYAQSHSIPIPNSIPMAIQNHITNDQNSNMAPYAQSHSIPIPNSIPMKIQNLITNEQNPDMALYAQSHSIPIPNSIHMGIQNPITNDQNPNMAPYTQSHSIPVPNSITMGIQNPITNDPNLYHLSQNSPNSIPIDHNPITSVQYTSISQNISPFSTPTKIQVPITSPQDPYVATHTVQNISKNQEILHFSHPHSLQLINLQNQENEISCSGCQETLVGNHYSCIEPNCEFHLDDSCFHLKQNIRHESHPNHPLTLLSSAPYKNENNEFTCNACFSDGTGFTYHCKVCQFDLHVQCVSLPKTVKRGDHKHALKLFYECPVKRKDYTFSCDVCHGVVNKDRWTYFCEECEYGTHLGCVDCEECDGESEIVDVQVELQRLQLQMEMSRQHAQMIASMGASIASLV